MAHTHHHHAHGHAHPHVHGEGEGATRRLRIVLVMTALFMVAEVVGGLVSNSLALLADAGHMLTDVGALALSLWVAWFTKQPATSQRTFGYLRAEILAAFVNGSALLLISAAICWEAVQRLWHPEPLATGPMLVVACLGLLVNMVAAWLLHADSLGSMNVRGAYLHILGDLLGSVGVIAAALIVRLTGWQAADPVASLLTTLMIVLGAWRLVRESVDVLLESAPRHIDVESVRRQIEAIPGVELVHDLHVWGVSSGMVAMSAHAVVRQRDQQQHVLEHVCDAMRLYGIEHVTMQLEQEEMFARERGLHR